MLRLLYDDCTFCDSLCNVILTLCDVTFCNCLHIVQLCFRTTALSNVDEVTFMLQSYCAVPVELFLSKEAGCSRTEI
jgi:hypothetical protein